MGTFEDYLKFEVTEAQEDEKQLRIIEKISLSEETEKAIKNLKREIEKSFKDANKDSKKIIEKLKVNGEYAKLVVEIENCRSKD